MIISTASTPLAKLTMASFCYAFDLRRLFFLFFFVSPDFPQSPSSRDLPLTYVVHTFLRPERRPRPQKKRVWEKKKANTVAGFFAIIISGWGPHPGEDHLE